MDVADLGLAGVSLVVAREPLPEIRLARLVAEDVPHDGLRPVPHVLQHFADAPLVAEPHDDETALGALRAFELRRVAPERARPGHDGLVKAPVREGVKPDLVNCPAVDFVNNVEVGEEAVIVHGVRFVEAGTRAEAVDVRVAVVDEAVHLDRDALHLDALADFKVGVAVAARAQVGDVPGRQIVGVIPSHRLCELAVLLRFDPGIVDDDEDAP